MERGSNKHSPEVDDQMAAEARGVTRAPGSGRVDDGRDPEPIGDRDEPAGTGDPLITDPETHPHEALARFASYLRRTAFPADREHLLIEANDNHAPDDVVDLISGLPDGSFRTVTEAWEKTPGASS
jgi:hypothetical protein